MSNNHCQLTGGQLYKPQVSGDQAAVASDISRLFLQSDLSDLVLVVADRRFPVHRVVLAARSQYFRALLYSGLKESFQNEIEIRDANEDAFEHVLRYIYRGSINLAEMQDDLVMDLLALVHRYGLQSVERQISGHLSQTLTLDNVVSLLNVAVLYTIQDLSDTCLRFLDKYSAEFLSSGIIAGLSQGGLCAIISRDSFCASEIIIFEAVVQWLDINKSICTADTVKQVLLHIRFCLISSCDLLCRVRPTGLVPAESILDAMESQLKVNRLPHRGLMIPEENLANLEWNASVIQGGPDTGINQYCIPEHIDPSDTVFAEHPIEEHGRIVVRLGNPSKINMIRMHLLDREGRSYSYLIDVSLDQMSWTTVADYRKYICRSWQTLFFDPIVVQYIRIIGTRNTVNRTFTILQFECLYTDIVREHCDTVQMDKFVIRYKTSSSPVPAQPGLLASASSPAAGQPPSTTPPTSTTTSSTTTSNVLVPNDLKSDNFCQVTSAAGTSRNVNADDAHRPISTNAANILTIQCNDFLVPKDRLSKDEYIRRGPIRPNISSYPKTVWFGKQRSFRDEWYNERPYLEYNMNLDAAFCFPCRIFSDICCSGNDLSFRSEGYRNWPIALIKGKGFDKHSSSQQHRISMQRWNDYLQAVPIDVQLATERARQIEIGAKERQERHDMLPILADLTNTLARLRLPFRGHNENEETSTNKGVFREIADLLARWNPNLSRHFAKGKSNPKGYPTYASPISPNHMIHSGAEVLRKEIAKEIKIAKYFAILLDTSPDNGKEDQLSFIIRYVNEDGGVIEAFLDMEHATHGDACTLFDLLIALLEKHDLSIENLRGQGYDGCATMAGKYRGLQARVKESSLFAYFVHCFCHRINLVVVDSCTKNVITRNFFGVVEKLYSFIEGSCQRHGIFRGVSQKLQEDKRLSGNPGTLKQLSNTRWSSRAHNLDVLEKSLQVVVTTLDEIALNAKYDREVAGEALALKKAIDFEFCICLATLSPLLRRINCCSIYLQSESMNISSACSLIEALIGDLQELRSENQFDKYWKDAERIAEEINVEYCEPRRKKVSRLIDSTWMNECELTGKRKYCITFFYEALGLMITTLENRFHPDVLPMLKAIRCLSSPSKGEMDNLKTLASFYPNDVDQDTITEEYNLFVRVISSSNLPNDVQTIFLHIVDQGMGSMFPNVFTLYRLIMTLPATSTSCERSFSALNFVKNKLRKTMTQGRLSDLMVVAVESERSKVAEVEDIVDFFWKHFDVERR